LGEILQQQSGIHQPGGKPGINEVPVLKGPGLGFELDWDAINQASDLYNKQQSDNS